MSRATGDRAAQLGIDVDSLRPLATCLTRHGTLEVRAGTLDARSLIVYGSPQWWYVAFLQTACDGPPHLMLHADSGGTSRFTKRVLWPFRPDRARLLPRQLTGYVNWLVVVGCPAVAGIAVDCPGAHVRPGLTTVDGCGIAILALNGRTRRLAVTAYAGSGQILEHARIAGSIPRARPGSFPAGRFRRI